MNKKAQIRLTETIAILFIFFILVALGIIFFYKYNQVAVKEKQQELLQARALDTTLKVLFLPELQCSKAEAEPEQNCMDLMKVRAAADVFSQHTSDYYIQLFSFSRISLHQVYPEREEWILYDKPAPDAEGNRVNTFFIVALRDLGEAANAYGYGYLNVTVLS